MAARAPRDGRSQSWRRGGRSRRPSRASDANSGSPAHMPVSRTRTFGRLPCPPVRCLPRRLPGRAAPGSSTSSTVSRDTISEPDLSAAGSRRPPVAPAECRRPGLSNRHATVQDRALTGFRRILPGNGLARNRVVRKIPCLGAELPAARPFLHLEAELLDPVANLVAIEAEQRRRPRLVAARPVERLDDELPLELLEVERRLPGVRHPARTARAAPAPGSGPAAACRPRSAASRARRRSAARGCCRATGRPRAPSWPRRDTPVHGLPELAVEACRRSSGSAAGCRDGCARSGGSASGSTFRR